MAGTRDRIIATTNELFRRHGFHDTALKDVTAGSGTTTGSLYHFFPGGKVELAEAVLLESGAAYQELFEAIWDASESAAEGIRAFFDGAADVLEQTDFIDICPIGTVAHEVASTNERLRTATAQVFGNWNGSLSGRLVRAGWGGDAAAELATALIAALEGTFMLARARRDADVVRTTGRLCASWVEVVTAG